MFQEVSTPPRFLRSLIPWVFSAAISFFASTAYGQADTARTLSEVLQTSGGWGLSAILMVVIWFLVRDNLKQRDARTNQMQVQYNALMEMLEKRIEADVKHEQAFRQLTEFVQKVLDKVR